MKEIDFLPEWYKSGRRRQTSYRTQYIALGGVFVLMMVWNLVGGRSISKATAELAREAPGQAEIGSASEEFTRIRSELTELRRKAESIKEIDSKIDVTSILGEMSFLVDGKIVLSRLEFLPERLADSQDGKANSGSAVRAAGGNLGRKRSLPLGDVRFKVVIKGVASDASDVAELVCKLEESAYFCEVTSSWRNKEIRAGVGLTKKGLRVSEFEIHCYLANYRQDASCFANETQNGKAEI
jgi:hypothetical protein